MQGEGMVTVLEKGGGVWLIQGEAPSLPNSYNNFYCFTLGSSPHLRYYPHKSLRMGESDKMPPGCLRDLVADYEL